MTVGVYKKQLGDGGSDGTVMGQSATSLIGFYGATPVAQASAITAATDATTVITQCNLVITALKNLGLTA